MSPVKEISSMPSAPCTTSTCSEPKFCNTFASFKVKSWLNTPISCRLALAGFVSGPSKLKIVRTPNSRRTGAACFIALWWLGANIKPIPISSTHLATCCGVKFTFTASASSTSALPQVDDTERPPCLATFAPAAAATKAEVVDTLNVWMPSPPVPQVSIKWLLSLIATFVERDRITVAAALISSTLSPFWRNAITKPAICAGVSSPLITCCMSMSISAWLKSLPAKICSSDCFKIT